MSDDVNFDLEAQTSPVETLRHSAAHLMASAVEQPTRARSSWDRT